MSAGIFVNSRYSSTRTGLIHPIRVQPETLSLVVNGVTNSPPAGGATSPISAQSSQSKRALGLNARTVTITFRTNPPAGYKVASPITLPWLNETGFDGFIKGQEVSYLEATGEVVGVSPETAR